MGGHGPDQPILSLLLVPCLAVGPIDGASGVLGTASGSALVSGEMPHTTQCAYGGARELVTVHHQREANSPLRRFGPGYGRRYVLLGATVFPRNAPSLVKLRAGHLNAQIERLGHSIHQHQSLKRYRLRLRSRTKRGPRLARPPHAARADRERHRNRCRVDRHCLALGRWLRRFWGGVARHAPIAPALSCEWEKCLVHARENG